MDDIWTDGNQVFSWLLRDQLINLKIRLANFISATSDTVLLYKTWFHKKFS